MISFVCFSAAATGLTVPSLYLPFRLDRQP